MVLPQDLDDHHFAIEGTFVEVEMLWGVVHMALAARPWEQPVAGYQD